MILKLNERQLINTEHIAFVNIEPSYSGDVLRVHLAGGYSHGFRIDGPEANAIQKWIEQVLGDGMFEYGFRIDKGKYGPEAMQSNDLETLEQSHQEWIETVGADRVGEIVPRSKILPLDVAAKARARKWHEATEKVN